MLLDMAEIHEGKAVLDLLTEAGYSQADFAKKYPSPAGGGLSGARTSKLMTVEKFKHSTWEKVRTALERLRLDPNRIRPVQVQQRARLPEDLRPLVAGFKPDQQEILLRILSADDDARQMLKVALEERLGRLQ